MTQALGLSTLKGKPWIVKTSLSARIAPTSTRRVKAVFLRVKNVLLG